MNQLHIRLLMADTGGGHRATAEALASSLSALDPGARVDVVDLFEAAGGLGRVPPLWYAWLTTHPRVWAALFHGLNGRHRRVGVWAPFYYPQRRTYDRIFMAEAPHALVVLHPGFTAAVGRAVARAEVKPALCTVVTDPITGHASWYEHRVDLTLVSTEAAAIRARALGVEPSEIEVMDHPVHPRIPPLSLERARLRRRYDWMDRQVVLCTGGGDAGGALRRLVRRLHREAGLHLVVVCGRNRAIARDLGRLPGVEVLGFVDDLPERMAAADVVVTKAGPSTLAEAGAVGTPIVVYDHMPGQEVGNLEWVSSRGWGRIALELEEVAPAVRAWLGDAVSRAELHARARKAALEAPISDRIAARLLKEARENRENRDPGFRN